jgi:hypothetical protein
MNLKRLCNEKLRIDSWCRSSALPPSEQIRGRVLCADATIRKANYSSELRLHELCDGDEWAREDNCDQQLVTRVLR